MGGTRATPSIRQPLVAYALVFMGAACFATATMLAFSSVSASRRAYQRAIEARLEVLARLPTPELDRVLTGSSLDEPEVRLIQRQRPTPGLSWERALELSRRPEAPWVVVRSVRDADALLAARLDPTIPTAIAFAAISRMIPFVLLTMLALAGFYTLMTSRLLLPPLDALATVADQVEDAEEPLDVLGRERAPNEIVEVAQKFRRTVRRLRSERERVEDQKRELERMQESLIRASKLAGIGRLAAGVAHEVGNPLAAVRGYLGLMESGLEPDEQAEVVRRSRKELDRIHETIRGLLAYARSGGDPEAERAAVSLRAAVADALALARGHPALRDVRIVVEDGPDPEVLAQPARLQQVLLNLILNAGQAMAGRAPREVRIRFAQAPGAEPRALLQVDDLGPGVPAELKDAIFDPFFSTKPPGEGTGLGLAVSRALMEGMDGDLTVGDAPTGGARFEVRLVATDAPARPSGSNPPVDPTSDRA